MARGNKALLIGGGIAVVAYVLYKKGVFQSFLSTYRIKLGSPSFDLSETQKSWYTKLYVKIPLMIDNPTEFTGKITGMKLAVSVNGKSPINISKSGEAVIAANSSSTINMLLGIPATTLPGIIQDLIKGAKGAPIQLALSGSIDTDKGLLTISQTITIGK